MLFKNKSGKPGCHWLLVVGLFLLFCKVAQAQDQDVRLLVDISGSMKSTDPNNLRTPATEMLVDLLPEGTEAGVWTFGRQVNMLIPHELVSEPWREKARRAAQEIASVGLFTDIDEVIETVTWDSGWETGKDRHLILLSDGQMDVSEAATERQRRRENLRLRDQLLRQRLPQLAAAGYTIHTLALSDEADHDLMATLAQRTGGLHAIAYEADDLMPLLLQILNRMVDSDQVPLVGNRFSIDPLINEFTVLVFHPEGAEVTLENPEGELLDQKEQRSGVNWHQGSGYTQITVQRPTAGDWALETAAHPDNRVTVVSDLKLQSTDFPATVYRGFPEKKQELRIWLTEEGQKIDRREFLRLLDAEVQHHKSDLLFSQQSLRLDDGRHEFVGSLADFTELGEQQVTILLDGKTFQRQITHSFNVQDVVAAHLQLPADGGVPQVILRAQHPDLDPLEVGFRVTANGDAQPVRYRGDGEWWVELRNLIPAEEYRIEVTAEGELQGERLEVRLPALYLEAGSVRTPDQAPQVEAAPQAPEPQAEPLQENKAQEPARLPPTRLPPTIQEEPQSQPQPQERQEPQEPEAESQPAAEGPNTKGFLELALAPIENWDDPRMLWIYIALGIANILLFAVAFMMYRRFVKRRQERKDALAHDDEDDGDEETPDIDDLEFDLGEDPDEGKA